MSKWLKGLAAAAALMWAGSAQAAYVQFTVNMLGVGTFEEDDPDFSDYHYWSGVTTATIYFTIEEGAFDGPYGGYVSPSGIGATVFADGCRSACGGSFSATLPVDTFADGARVLDGPLVPISSTAFLSFDQHYAGQTFHGTVTSIQTELVDIMYGSGGSIDPVHRYPVPEPSTWAMMLIGFGVIGASMRRRYAANSACLAINA